MSWIVLLLGLVLAAAGGASLWASIDLAGAELGVLYATCGAICVSGGVVTIGIGLLIGRVDALRAALLRDPAPAAAERAEPLPPPPPAPDMEPAILAEPGAEVPPEAPDWAEREAQDGPAAAAAPDRAESAGATPAGEPAPDGAPVAEAPVEAGAPTTEEPATRPTLVGRFSAGGSDYSIFTDGSIEAQTSQGEYRFASMDEFKAFIAAKKR
ncbi:MAG: hypothetical protein ABSG83_03245 [Roseiarcus sp.]|jgi:hypothetical protein